MTLDVGKIQSERRLKKEDSRVLNATLKNSQFCITGGTKDHGKFLRHLAPSELPQKD